MVVLATTTMDSAHQFKKVSSIIILHLLASTLSKNLLIEYSDQLKRNFDWNICKLHIFILTGVIWWLIWSNWNCIGCIFHFFVVVDLHTAIRKAIWLLGDFLWWKSNDIDYSWFVIAFLAVHDLLSKKILSRDCVLNDDCSQEYYNSISDEKCVPIDRLTESYLKKFSSNTVQPAPHQPECK